MTEETRLSRFILRRFLITLIIVGATEFILSSFINHTLLPVMSDVFFPSIKDSNILSAGNIIIIVLLMLLYFTAQITNKLFPGSSGYIITFVNKRLDAISSASGNREAIISDSIFASMSGKEVLFLCLTLIAIVILTLIPIAVGALIFSGQVTREFRHLDSLRAAEQKENERKRYLMISDIAHDLKTPMTTVSGYARALSDGMVRPEKQKDYLDAITAKSERMNDIIQMLFNYSRLDSDGFELVKKHQDICEIVRECVAASYSDIEAAGDEIEIDIPENILTVCTDKMQISRVITNLLTNAVKHNDKGISILVRIADESDLIRIFVADSGAQIDKQLAHNIFEPFVMGDDSRSSKGGSGLGLSIARKVVEMHGWTIKLAQNPEIARYGLPHKYNKTFVISIPVE